MPSKCSRNWSASKAFDGISHIISTFSPSLPRARPLRRQQFRDRLGLLHRAHEGHHDLHVVQTHLFAHAQDGLALQFETGLEGRIHVAGCAPESQHGILLVGFVATAANEIGVFVRLEVRQADDDRLRRKGRSDLRHALRQARDEELPRDWHSPPVWVPIARASRHPAHRSPAAPCGCTPIMRLMMNSRRASPTPRFGNMAKAEGSVRIADVHHDPHGRRRQRLQLEVLLVEAEDALVYVAGVPLRAGHRHGRAFRNRRPSHRHNQRLPARPARGR